jgi:hypothetical protein
MQGTEAEAAAMTHPPQPLTENEAKRKIDAALRMSMIMWAFQDGEITKEVGKAQVRADPDIMLFWVRDE